MIGSDSYVKVKLKKKAGKIRGFLQTLTAVPDVAAKAYHAERLAFRVLKETARSRAQGFLRVFSPEITEEAAKIVDEACEEAEASLLGWSADEIRQARQQACLHFDDGGHDMQPRSDDRFILYLAAWLEAIEEEDDDRTDTGQDIHLPVGVPRRASHKERKLSRITRRAVLEHPLLAPRLEQLYSKARELNTSLPNSLKKFIDEAASGERSSGLVVKGRVKWQKALMLGLKESRAERWLKSAPKKDRERVKEMSGGWILMELPWWTHFQRPTWRIAMRLRYGLQVTPAVGAKPAPRCLAKKKDGSFCLEQLDAFGQHAQVCKVEGAAVIRHDTIRDGIVPELKGHVTSVKVEQFIHELAQLDENTGETQEAKMDIVAESPMLRAMLDVRCYLSTLKRQWRSARAHEIEKHQRYVTHSDGRRCTNLTLYPAVVNTYGYVGQEFRDFCATIDIKGRGRRLSTLFSLLGVYANAEQVLLAYTPSQSRAQREDVLAAIAAKEAEVASSQEQPEGQLRQAQPSKAGKARSPDSEVTSNPKATIRPDLRGEISGADGKNPKIFCLACKAWKPYATFGRHCNINHKQNDSQDVDETEVADKAEKGPLPKKKAEPKRTSRKEPVSRASEKGPKKKKTNINSGKPSKP